MLTFLLFAWGCIFEVYPPRMTKVFYKNLFLAVDIVTEKVDNLTKWNIYYDIQNKVS